jgi:hypothetical protein
VQVARCVWPRVQVASAAGEDRIIGSGMAVQGRPRLPRGANERLPHWSAQGIFSERPKLARRRLQHRICQPVARSFNIRWVGEVVRDMLNKRPAPNLGTAPSRRCETARRGFTRQKRRSGRLEARTLKPLVAGPQKLCCPILGALANRLSDDLPSLSGDKFAGRRTAGVDSTTLANPCCRRERCPAKKTREQWLARRARELGTRTLMATTAGVARDSD